MTLMAMPAQAGKYTNAIAAAGGLQGRVLWCDAEANLWNLDTRDKVAEIARLCKEANINTIVVDVKPLAGVVLYKSRIAPRLVERQGRPYPQDHDLLQAVVEEGHRAGIDVYAAINVFSEGAANGDAGAAFSHPEWQCTKYEVERWARGPTDAYPVSALNCAPMAGRLALVTDDNSVPKQLAQDVVRVAIDATGKVVAAETGPLETASPLPSGGYALLGSGPAGAWLISSSVLGGQIAIEGKPRFVPVGKAADEHRAVFVNPASPDARAYELSIIREIIANYDVDGIVFDRMRYPDIFSDFSDFSRSSFETWLGQKVERFPEDIFTIEPLPGRDVVRGKYFAKWMEWRAKQTHDFVAEARTLVKSAKPKALVAAYVGSWYGSYYGVGVNWASPSYQPPYDFAGPTYKETGYANLLDWLCTGCYYKYPTRAEARAAGASEWGSVEAAAQESNQVVVDDAFVYGGLYLLEYKADPAGFERAIATCAAETQGVMLFDLVYLRDYNWWDILKRVFPAPARPPHSIPGLIDKVKEIRQLIKGSGKQ
jgi:uncharacterized lipoprotein YddW (UPF0748 family)